MWRSPDGIREICTSITDEDEYLIRIIAGQWTIEEVDDLARAFINDCEEKSGRTAYLTEMQKYKDNARDFCVEGTQATICIEIFTPFD